MRPRNIVLGHWEDFFRKQGKPVKALRATNVGYFIKRLEAVKPEDSQWFMPLPFIQMRFLIKKIE